MEDGEKGNPDAIQDEKLIERLIAEWCQRELLPVFQQIKSEIDQLKQVQEAIVGGFGEAVSGHRRSSLMDSIDLSDLGETGDVYKDLEGSDLKEDLINYIMEQDIPDEKIEETLQTLKENARSKYGKYRKAEPEVPPEMGKPGDGVLAVKIGVGKPGEEPEEGEEEPKSPVDAMFGKVMDLHKKKSLSKSSLKL